MSMPTAVSASASPEVQMNNNSLATAWAYCYAVDGNASGGLHRIYSGGRWGGFAPSDVDHTFGTSVTTYVSVHRSDGTLNFSTSSTNYNDATNYARVETVVTDGSGVTAVTDDRGGPGGVHGGGGGAGTGVTIDTDPTLSANSDSVVPSQKATKAYADAHSQGIQWKTAMDAATTTVLPANTYANGTLGVGATLTGNSNGALTAQDTVTLTVSQRLLVKNEAAPANDGLYQLTQVGDGSHPYILTRTTDADTAAELLQAGVLIVGGGQAKQNWVCNTSGTITVGTTALSFVKQSQGSGDASTNTAVSVVGEIALFADTLGKTLKRATLSGYAFLTAGVLSIKSLAQLITDLQGDGLTGAVAGFRNIPFNPQSVDYTCVAADSGKAIFHPKTDSTARRFSIDTNANVAHPVGTAITFINQRGAGNVTIGIAIGGTDTLDFAGTAASTGDRTLGPNGWATAIKMDSTSWLISGTNLT